MYDVTVQRKLKEDKEWDGSLWSDSSWKQTTKVPIWTVRYLFSISRLFFIFPYFQRGDSQMEFIVFSTNYNVSSGDLFNYGCTMTRNAVVL